MVSRREEKGMKYISVVVPEDIDRELRFACADQATTKSRLVRRLIEQYLEEWREDFEGMGGQIIGLNDKDEETDHSK
jgi:predicted DNA-binding protein